jgi:hypothetical protein
MVSSWSECRLFTNRFDIESPGVGQFTGSNQFPDHFVNAGRSIQTGIVCALLSHPGTVERGAVAGHGRAYAFPPPFAVGIGIP